jgi:hypothetical protein
LAEAKASLRLTPEQEALWAPVADAVRSLRNIAAPAEQGMPGDAMERLRRQADRSASRAEALKRLADAAQPLWNALSEEQKRVLPRALRYAARMDDEERTTWRERDDERSDRRMGPDHMMGRDGMRGRGGMMGREDMMGRDGMAGREERWRDRDAMGGRDYGTRRHDRGWQEDSDAEMRGRFDDRRMGGRRGGREDEWDSRDGYGRHYDGRRFDDEPRWSRRGDDDADRRGWRGFGRDRFGCD